MMIVAPEEGNDVEVQHGGLGDDDNDGGEAEESVVQDLSVTQEQKRRLATRISSSSVFWPAHDFLL